MVKTIAKFILGIVVIMSLLWANIAFGARTDSVWQRISTHLETTCYGGCGILLEGVNKFLSFGSTYGESGYGFRDDSGTMKFKNSGGVWTEFGTGTGTSSGLVNLNGLTADPQYFATSSSDNVSIDIVSSGDTHTFTTSILSGYVLPLIASTTEWATAYGWGDHSLVGYLTSFTESDPIWIASSTNYYTKAEADSADDDTIYWSLVSGGLETATSTDFARASHFIATSTETSTFAGEVNITGTTTINDDLLLVDNSDLYFDTAQTQKLWYNPSIGQINIGNETQAYNYFGVVRSLGLSSNSGVAGGGTWEPSVYLNENGTLSLSNTTQGAVGNKYLDVHFTDGMKFRSDSSNKAQLLTDNLTTTDRAFQFPDSSGTFALTGDLSNFIALTDLSNTATGLTYNNTTGETSLTSGYVIPLIASTTQWANAFSWGDHSLVGYLTSYTETDSIWVASSTDWLSKEEWNATTTDALTQGSTNLYNQTHSGEVTGSIALTISSNIVDEDNLKIHNTPTDDYVLTASSTATGGLVWGSPAGGGTVTSVAQTVPLGWTITGSPITGAGTLALDYDTGYGAVLTASTTNWNSFYNTPSTRIIAGTNLSWTDNTLNATGGSGAWTDLGSVVETTGGESARASYFTATSTTGTSTFAGHIAVGGTYANAQVNGNSVDARIGVWNDNPATVWESEIGLGRVDNTNAVAGATIYGGRSRGTFDTQTVVQNGDNLFDIVALGHDGTDFAISSRIDMEADGVPSNDGVEGRIVFKTSADGSQDPTEAMRITSQQYIGVGTTAPATMLDVYGTSTTLFADVKSGITLMGEYITDFTSYVRGLFSETVTGLTYNSSTGVTSLDVGYEIPLTASTTNWESAYGWGDHDLVGYLTSYTETDPIWIASSTNYDTSGEVDAKLALQDECSEITGCVTGALTTESDPVWIASSTNYYTKTESDANYDVLGQATSTMDTHTTTYNHDNFITGNETITLSGDITGSGATAITTAIASGVIVEADLNVNTPVNGYALLASSTATGGFAWGSVAGGGDTWATIQSAGTGVSTNAPTLDFDADFTLTETPTDDFDITITDDTLDYTHFSNILTIDQDTTLNLNTGQLGYVWDIADTGTTGNNKGGWHVDNSDNTGHAMTLLSTMNASAIGPLVRWEASDIGFDKPVLEITNAGTAGSASAIRINGPRPEIEFWDTDYVSPEGAFELLNNGDRFNISGRNLADTGFEPIVEFYRIADSGDVNLLDSGSAYQINATDVLASTTLGAGVVNSSLTSVGTIGNGVWNGTAINYSYLSMANSILESDLQVVDTPTDEECLTYEATGGDFEWQSCGAGGGGTTDGTNVTYVTDTADAFAVGSTATSTAEFWVDPNISKMSLGDGGGGDSLFSLAVSGVVNWVFGLDDSDNNNFVISSGTDLGTNNVFVASSTTAIFPNSVKMPYGTAPAINSEGEYGYDTTDDQFLIHDGTAQRVYGRKEVPLFAITIASTSVAFVSGGSLDIAKNTKDGRDITQYRCHVVGGTSVVANTSDNGTNDTETITCGTTQTSDTDVATNSIFTADELWRLEFGTITGSPDYLVFEAYGYITVE